MTINTSLENEIDTIENKLTINLKVAKDTADKALSIANLCKQIIDDLTTKYDSLYKTNSETQSQNRSLQNRTTELQNNNRRNNMIINGIL